ncbi:Uncharacterized protein APZ42_010968 [Daphnia magna]|uniref:Integrase zinc-binding domain-containing protein n=1 Tax=Daphnia magna TaxID=35525 RepID=A0A162TCR6_9CRUS|nr:Uncharacterized protein APZ42_010968 [Daphnia magna]
MRLRLCLPPGQRSEVLKASQYSMMSGHLGTRSTLSRIEEKYYWPGLKQRVVSYVHVCTLYQARKSPPREPQGYMEIIKVERPFEQVGMDILGPFPMTAGENRNIIVAVDY